MTGQSLMIPGRSRAAWPMLLAGVFFYLLWDLATWAWYVWPDQTVALPEYLFMKQDMPVLIGMAVGLIALIPIDRRKGVGAPAVPSGWAIALAAVLVVVAARIGRDLVFHAYSPSRDEVMVEMAGAYFAAGHIGWSIPSEWLEHARAMQPEFYSPYGADRLWTSIYLPVHAAIRGLFVKLGDGDWASPVMLGVGLLALWDAAKRLFPQRRDTRAVVMILALTSVQLVATAMTPYAMTSHFALNTLWLALILRGGVVAGALAAVVLVLAAGLHQWHFPILFVAPFIGWLLLRRRWGMAVVQTGALGLAVLLWAKLWPMLLAHVLGPPDGGHMRGAPDVDDKVMSLFGRLQKWQPLLNIARLMAWNNILLLPLGALSVAKLRPLKGLWREPSIVLPLLGTVVIGFATALYQGYGWGFRYMHGSLGALCLLAGYGWTVLSPDGLRPMRVIWAGSALSLVTAAWLLVTTQEHVAPYARTMAAIRASDADAVLVDLRGGYFMTDLVRFQDGRPGKPAVMALAMMDEAEVDDLCARHKVALMDNSQFWALGVHEVNPVLRTGPWLDKLRVELNRLGCGKPVITINP
ncbi:MAG TPA: MFS transporter [Sphingobium sp.]|uniref:MFS transporter n=1 Tax=Sphingobium sp. TaxID=1912891 RepID=UPI002ED4F82A